MVSNLVENLTRDVMLELAGESYFERGEDYHRGGHVHDLVEHAGVVVARVAGTEDYRVRLWAEDDLVFTCDCPLGLDGEFCKHCVAAGLAWFEDDFLENAPGGSATMHDVHTYLEKQERGGPGPYRDAAGDGGRATAGAAPAADLACGGSGPGGLPLGRRRRRGLRRLLGFAMGLRQRHPERRRGLRGAARGGVRPQGGRVVRVRSRKDRRR
jgi:hypothetical protein